MYCLKNNPHPTQGKLLTYIENSSFASKNVLVARDLFLKLFSIGLICDEALQLVKDLPTDIMSQVNEEKEI